MHQAFTPTKTLFDKNLHLYWGGGGTVGKKNYKMCNMCKLCKNLLKLLNLSHIKTFYSIFLLRCYIQQDRLRYARNPGKLLVVILEQKLYSELVGEGEGGTWRRPFHVKNCIFQVGTFNIEIIYVLIVHRVL